MRRLSRSEAHDIATALCFLGCPPPPAGLAWTVRHTLGGCVYSALRHEIAMPPECHLQLAAAPAHCLPELCRLLTYARWRARHGLLSYWRERLFGKQLVVAACDEADDARKRLACYVCKDWKGPCRG